MDNQTPSRIVVTGFACLLMTMGLLLSACSSMGGKAAGASTPACPLCGEVTSQIGVKALKYTKCACPDCKTVSTIDPFAPASMKDYVDRQAAYVHVCDSCDCMVAACPKCRGM